MSSAVTIRAAGADDAAALWAVIAPVIRAGETYTLDRDMTETEAMAFWLGRGHVVFVAEADGDIVGTYYLCANQAGGGNHVANAGYVTAAAASRRGVARSMCAHSIAEARRRGFRAMQFNHVVSSNARAVALWQAMGFAIVGRLPLAFRHPTLGYVDALVMYQALTA